jgi:hypothetical protein
MIKRNPLTHRQSDTRARKVEPEWIRKNRLAQIERHVIPFLGVCFTATMMQSGMYHQLRTTALAGLLTERAALASLRSNALSDVLPDRSGSQKNGLFVAAATTNRRQFLP